MKELTNEQIARVFAMYMPCNTVQGENNFNRRLVAVGGFEDGDFTYGKLKNKASTAAQFVSNFKIVLTPLSAISDEDAIESMAIQGYTKNDGYTLEGWKWWIEQMCKDNCIPFPLYQYLIQKSYAVPLFIAPNHPANGKTAIELGLAVDATKEKEAA